MKNNIIVQSIALTLISSSAFSVFADEKVVVTANRITQELTDTLASVVVIDRADIERIQPQSFVDLLVNIAGIDVVQKGGQGQDVSVFARGANSNQMLVLVDGVRVGSATLAIKSLANVSISQIERVEIVKGPRAALWGSDAIGGVIQIFTRQYENGEHRVALTVGSNSTSEIDASIGLGNDQLSNTLTFSHKQTDGISARFDGDLDKDGYDNNSLAIRGNYQVSDTALLDWTVQADKGEIEFDSFFGDDQFEYNNHLWNLRYSRQMGDWSNQLAVSRSRDQNFSNATSFETRRQQASLLTRNNISDSLSFGGGVEWLQDSVDKSTTVYNVEQRTTKSGHLNLNYSGKVWLTDLALRYDDVENVSSEISANLGLGYRLNEQNLLSLNYAEGFKAPSFNDLYYPFGGNADLQFETSTNLELVYKGFYEFGNLVVSVFDSQIDNLIQWTPDINGNWAPQNIGEAAIFGLESSFKLQFGGLQHEFSASYIDAENSATQSQLALRAKKQFGYQLSFNDDFVDWFAQLQHVGERPDTDYQSFMPTMLDSYTRVNVGVGYTLNSQWKLQLKVNDVFDEAPTIASGYTPVEREFYLTISHHGL